MNITDCKLRWSRGGEELVGVKIKYSSEFLLRSRLGFPKNCFLYPLGSWSSFSFLNAFDD